VGLTIIASDRFADHLTPPGHFERPARHEVMQQVAEESRCRGGMVAEPRPATDEEIVRVHDADYLRLVKGTAGRAVALDPDTFTSPESYEVARLAAGAAVSAVDHVLRQGGNARALALVRPPGHHAELNKAMGFCLFNNIAIAAAHARAKGLDRVAVVDYDVHHGNGTQASFYADHSVLFISSHQYPYYPGTGAADEVGHGAGKGFTVNLPFSAGATDVDYRVAYERIALPILRRFKPQLILLSAGFDAYTDDPLGGMRLTADGFEWLTAAIVDVAEECCQGRLVAATEGGYDLTGLGLCLRAAVRVLEGERRLRDLRAPEGSAPWGEATMAAVMPHVAPYWTLAPGPK
jgi:acetoin utilization deacetylase AcuC-like enzyme